MSSFRLALLVTLLWPVRAPSTAQANDAEPPFTKATIEATLSEEGDLLTGTVTLEITNQTDVPLPEIPLWLYPNRFQAPSPELREGAIKWIYPKGKSAGRMTIDRVEWNSRALSLDRIAYPPTYFKHVAVNERIIARVALGSALPPGESGRFPGAPAAVGGSWQADRRCTLSGRCLSPGRRPDSRVRVDSAPEPADCRRGIRHRPGTGGDRIIPPCN